MNGNFTIISRSQLPQDATVLPAVWQMKRQRNIKSGKIKKYKARPNIDGSKMIKGKHYELTYAPVVRWFSVRLLLVFSIVNNWQTKQIDYVWHIHRRQLKEKFIWKYQGVWSSRKEERKPCTKTTSKHLRSETGRQSMVQIPERETYLYRVYKVCRRRGSIL